MDTRQTDKATQNGWGPMIQVALEQGEPRQRRIVHDPLVHACLPLPLRLLARVAGSGFVRERLVGTIDRRVPGVRGGVLCRKRYIEERLIEAASAGLEATVILDAGMDTVAYRVAALREIPVYEVDMPETIARKKTALRRALGEVPDRARLIPVDFDRQDLGEALRGAGYRPDIAAFFVWEGVTQYITETAARRALEAIRPANKHSRLVFTYIVRDFIDGRYLYGLDLLYRQARARRSTWKFGLEPGAVAAFLEPYGWREVEQVGSAEYQALYLLPAGRTLPVMAIERLVYAEMV